MSSPLFRGLYALAQSARAGLYFGQYLLSARLTRPVRRGQPSAGPFPSRNEILRDLRRLFARDLANIEAGLYRPPHDLMEAPFAALAGARRYFADLPQVERRRHADASQEVRQRAPRPGYPSYYQQNFHFQTDGWFSEESARLYDHQVEVLFGGGADAMRRMALVPLKTALAGPSRPSGVRFASPRRSGYGRAGGRPQTAQRLIDLGCGTGRLLSFVKQNYPRLPVVGLDLSLPYLGVAQRRLAGWRNVGLIQAPLEAAPLAAASAEAVTAVFLLHELPRKVRGALAREAARLLKPGGTLIVVDSIQTGDVPAYDALLQHFPVAFHEPYYADYLSHDLTKLFAVAGFTPLTLEIAYFARVMSFRKEGA